MMFDMHIQKAGVVILHGKTSGRFGGKLQSRLPSGQIKNQSGRSAKSAGQCVWPFHAIRLAGGFSAISNAIADLVSHSVSRIMFSLDQDLGCRQRDEYPYAARADRQSVRGGVEPGWEAPGLGWRQ